MSDLLPQPWKDRDGKELWDVQAQYMEKFYLAKGGWPAPEQIDSVTKDYLIHLIKEATEVLDEVSWKMHRAPKEYVDRDNVLEELIDCQKYLWGLMQVWGFTWDQFKEEFRRKSMVVEQRFAQEQGLSKLSSHPVAIVDIDGVLADYPRCFYEWCIRTFFMSMSLHEFEVMYREMPVLNRADLKHKYRQSGAKASVAVAPGAKRFLECVRRRSQLKVVLLTNRPYHRYYRIYPDTLEWLKKNELWYDGIVWGQDKGVDAVRQFKNICWAVEDDPLNAAKLRDARITTIRVDNTDADRSTAALWRMAERIPKMEDLGYEWNRVSEEVAS